LQSLFNVKLKPAQGKYRNYKRKNTGFYRTAKINTGINRNYRTAERTDIDSMEWSIAITNWLPSLINDSAIRSLE